MIHIHFLSCECVQNTFISWKLSKNNFVISAVRIEKLFRRIKTSIVATIVLERIYIIVVIHLVNVNTTIIIIIITTILIFVVTR